jgi:hypothetical protein
VARRPSNSPAYPRAGAGPRTRTCVVCVCVCVCVCVHCARTQADPGCLGGVGGCGSADHEQLASEALAQENVQLREQLAQSLSVMRAAAHASDSDAVELQVRSCMRKHPERHCHAHTRNRVYSACVCLYVISVRLDALVRIAR